MSKSLKTFLVISILLNTLLIGVLIGHFSKHGRRSPRHPRSQALLAELPKEKAQAFQEAMDGLRKASRKDKKKLESARKQVIEVLTAPQFNAQAFMASLNAVHDIHGELKEEMGLTVSKLASGMNQDERKILAKMLEKGPLGPGPHHRGKRHRSRHPPPPGMGPPGQGPGFPPPDSHRGPPRGPPPEDPF